MPSQRPKTVPDNAHWVGGGHGGSDVSVEPVDARPGRYRVRVFDEHTGQPLAEAEATPRPPAAAKAGAPAAAADPALPEAWDGWDGRTLLLKDGSTLPVRA